MASKIKVDQLETVDGTGNITVNQPLSGSGAGLTSLPAANLTGSLPAISGASLTGIPAANITGVIPAANLGTGSPSASTFLNGSGAYSAAGGGAWTLLGKHDYAVTNASTLNFDHFVLDTPATGYSLYAFVLNGVGNLTTDWNSGMRIGSPTVATSTHYSVHRGASSSHSASYYAEGPGLSNTWNLEAYNVLAYGNGMNMVIYFSFHGQTSTTSYAGRPSFFGNMSYEQTNGNTVGGYFFGSFASGQNWSRLQYYSSVAHTHGKAIMYGIKDS